MGCSYSRDILFLMIYLFLDFLPIFLFFLFEEGGGESRSEASEQTKLSEIGKCLQKRLKVGVKSGEGKLRMRDKILSFFNGNLDF